MNARISTALLSIGLALAGCEGQPGANGQMPGPPSAERSSRAIFNGTAAPNFYGTVIVSSAKGSCSGSIINSRWVLTAAHCFPANADANGDGTITAAESTVTISGTSSAFSGTKTHARTVKHPQSNWGLSNGSDSALVQVAAGTFNVGALSSDMYTSGWAKLNQQPTTDLNGHPELLSLGYARTSPGGAFGTLHYGWHTVPAGQAFVGWYRSSTGTGTSCNGDSGGPDWAWMNGPGQAPGWYLVGVHSNGDQVCDGATMSTNIGVKEIRSWILSCAGGSSCS